MVQFSKGVFLGADDQVSREVSGVLLVTYYLVDDVEITLIECLVYLVSYLTSAKGNAQNYRDNLEEACPLLPAQNSKIPQQFLVLNHFPRAAWTSHFKFPACLIFSKINMKKANNPPSDNARNDTKLPPNILTKPVQFPVKSPPKLPSNQPTTNLLANKSYKMTSNTGPPLRAPDTRAHSTQDSTSSKLAHFDKVHTLNGQFTLHDISNAIVRNPKITGISTSRSY